MPNVQILTAFQEMGMHEANNIALTHLALLCYETLRPKFPNLVDVLRQVEEHCKDFHFGGTTNVRFSFGKRLRMAYLNCDIYI